MGRGGLPDFFQKLPEVFPGLPNGSPMGPQWVRRWVPNGSEWTPWGPIAGPPVEDLGRPSGRGVEDLPYPDPLEKGIPTRAGLNISPIYTFLKGARGRGTIVTV